MGRRSVEGDESSDSDDFDVGGDVFYQVTPSLTATFTVNTDFAEAEVDQRRVNLTRFPLFFPEKRDFFLEGSEHFGFGGLLKSPLAFHSRNIGLSADGEKVDILGGAKLTGRQGPIGIGMLGMWLDDLGELQSDQVFVGRFTYDILDQSKIGAIFTHGDPRANVDNQLTGFDLNLRETNWIGDQGVSLHTFYKQSDDSEAGAASSYGVRASYPNRPVRIFGQWMRVEEEFEPGVGFVRRPGRDLASLEGRYAFYPPNRDVIDDLFLGLEWFRFTEIASGALETERFEGPTFSVDTRVGDEFGFGPVFEREVLFEPFKHRGQRGDSSRRLRIQQPAGVLGDQFQPARFFGSGGAVRPVFLAARPSPRNWKSPGGPHGSCNLTSAASGPTPAWKRANLRRWSASSISWSRRIGGCRGTRCCNSTTSPIRWGSTAAFATFCGPAATCFFVFNKGFDAEDDRFRAFSEEAIGKLGWTFRF